MCAGPNQSSDAELKVYTDCLLVSGSQPCWLMRRHGRVNRRMIIMPSAEAKHGFNSEEMLGVMLGMDPLCIPGVIVSLSKDSCRVALPFFRALTWRALLLTSSQVGTSPA